MGKLFVRRVTESKRNLIAILQYILIFCSTIAALILFGISIYIVFYFTSKAHLLGESFSFRPFGLIYIFVSALICIQECGLCYVLYHSRQIENRGKLIEKGWMDTLIYSLIFSTVILLPATLLYSFWFKSGISAGFHEGMKANLRKFNDNRAETVVFNRLQFEHQCCGVKNFEDWKDVENFGDMVTNKGVLKWFRVPFSCCKIRTLSLCYNDRKTWTISTINKDGCATKFQTFIDYRIYFAIILWILILFLQFSSLLLFQYWKTSLVSAFKRDRPTGRGEGWLYLPLIGEFQEPPTASTRRTKRRKVEEKQPLINDLSDGSPAEDYLKLKKEKADQLITILDDIPDLSNHSKTEYMPNKLEVSPRYSLLAPELPNRMTKKCKTCGRNTFTTDTHLCLGEQHNRSMALIAISDNDRSTSADTDSSSDRFGTEYQKNYQKKPSDKQTSVKTNKTEVKTPIDLKAYSKIDAKTNIGMTTTDDDITQTDPTKRKYRERYFILKEIR